MFKDRDWKKNDRKQWIYMAVGIILLSLFVIVYNRGYNRGYETGDTDASKRLAEKVLENLDSNCKEILLKNLEKNKGN